MRVPGHVFILTCFIFAFATTAEAISLEKRHHLELRLNTWSQVTGTRTEVRPGTVSTTVDAGGFGGSLSYGHWLSEAWAFDISVGGMAADVSVDTGVSETTTDTAVISQILLSTKFYFLPSTYSSGIRPFVKAGVGPFIGSQTRTDWGFADVLVESRTETVVGAQLGAGVDFIVGRHFLTGMRFGYNLMDDFDQAIGGSRNYSGPVFGIGFSYIFGKGVS